MCSPCLCPRSISIYSACTHHQRIITVSVMAYIQLPTPQGLDRVSLLGFSAPSDDMLLVSSYDKSTLFFSCAKQQLLGQISLPSPILDTTLSDSKSTFSGLLDGSIRYIDYENIKVSSCVEGLDVSGDVPAGVNHIQAITNNQLIATSFSGRLLQIDARTHRVTESKNTGSKIFAMDASHNYVSLGKSGQCVEIFDIRNLQSPVNTRPTGLRFQTTSLRHFPSGQGYALSSIDGRVSVEYFDELPEGKYAFKCHRIKDQSLGIDTVYPVSALRFHPRYQTLFTAGGDGNVCVWNWMRRKRMKVFPVGVEPQSISHMDLNADWLAVGVGDSSYSMSKSVGEMKRGDGAVFIKPLTAQDCEPKAG